MNTLDIFMAYRLRLSIFAFFLLSCFSSFAQDWKWLNHITGNYSQTILSSVTDGNGNTYVCGKFEDQFIDDNLEENTFGAELLFVAKYNGQGKRLWFVRADY